MNITGANILKKEIYPEWIPLLSFGATQTRTSADGWHSYPYSNDYIRTLGVRYMDGAGNVVNHQIANRRNNVYVTHATQNGFTLEIKFDPAKLSAIWYRYSNVNGILVPFIEMPNLRILSIRDHLTDFGNLDLSGNPLLSHFDISNDWKRGTFGSVSSIVFHPDAPLKLVYLTDCNIPTSVVDACLTQCYNHRNTEVPNIQNNKNFLSQRVAYSPGLQYMVDELVNDYGWTGFGQF